MSLSEPPSPESGQSPEAIVHIDLSEAREFVSGLLQESGAIAKRYFESRDFSIRQKTDFDITTQADLEIEALLKQRLSEKYPQTEVLAEESASNDYSQFHDTSGLWVIDPIDGTGNFSRGYPHFAISVALVDKGQPQLAVIATPMNGKIYAAQADKEGATMNDTSIHVSDVTELGKSTIETDLNWASREFDLSIIQALAPYIRQGKIMGSSVSGGVACAEGSIDAYVHRGAYPWDVAATGLLVQKAGGKVTAPDGGFWNIFTKGFLFTNGVLHEEIVRRIAAAKR